MTKQAMLYLAAALVFPVPLQADIYETTDAQGNAVFSDHPDAGAEEVTLPPANVADPLAPDSDASPAGPAPQEEPQKPTIVVVPNAHNEEVRSEFESGSRHDVREAQDRREVLEAEKRHEVR